MMMRWCVRIGLVVALLMSVARPHVLAAQDTTIVFVFRDRIMVTILPPKIHVRPPRALQYGFYSWRIDFKSNEPVSIAFTADTAIRTTNMRDIVRASSLRRCADVKDFSTLRCKIPMSDSVSVRGDGLRIVLRDENVVAMMRKYRPKTVWASTFEPNGQFRLDQIPVRYADGDGDEPAFELPHRKHFQF